MLIDHSADLHVVARQNAPNRLDRRSEQRFCFLDLALILKHGAHDAKRVHRVLMIGPEHAPPALESFAQVRLGFV